MGTSDEKSDINTATVDNWREKLLTVFKGYTSQNSFNMDEKGLFYRHTTQNMFKGKGKEWADGKQSCSMFFLSWNKIKQLWHTFVRTY